MKKSRLFQKPMLLLSFLFITTLAFSQVTQEWVKRYNGPSNGGEDRDVAYALAVDGSGNVYVTGYSEGSGTDFDYATVKYNAAGNEIWVRRYNGPGNSRDEAKDIAVDSAGNVYVTGSSNADIVTIKYNAAGNQLWLRRNKYNSNVVSASAADMAVDAIGNVYITGVGYTSEESIYITVKYDPSGNQLWAKYYRSEGAGDAVPTALALDGLGNVYVTGQSSPEYGRIEDRYTTIKYDTIGTELWVRDYNNPDIYSATAYALAVDASGNVYVTGDIGTVKYSAGESGGWVRDAGRSVAADGAGNVYVLTWNRTTKYDAAGNFLWTRYGGVSDARSLVLDGLGNVYTAGGAPPPDSEDPDITSYNFFTRKYDAVGNELWVQYYDGPGHTVDVVTALAVDASGNVYVTGGIDEGLEYTTIKYSQTQTAQTVSSFTLVNSDSNKDIRELKDGDTLNLAALATLNLNIRANTAPAAAGSVVFKLSGAETRNQTESIVPYALFADNNHGDYYAWTPTNGNYTLTATPYSAKAGSGTAGTPLTIHFIVTGQVVSSLMLVNAEIDQDIKPLLNGDVIDLSSLPTTKLNIRAVVHPNTVGSVVFNLNNKIIVRENFAPYAIGGDIKGNYRSWTLPTGHHTLTATPYALAYGKGNKGKALSVTFTVADISATVQANAVTLEQKAIAEAAQNVEQRLSATPNPFAGQTTIHFSVPTSSRTMLEVYDTKGAVVARLYDAQAEAGKGYRITFESKQLTAGVYMVKLTSGKQVQSYKLVLIR